MANLWNNLVSKQQQFVSHVAARPGQLIQNRFWHEISPYNQIAAAEADAAYDFVKAGRVGTALFEHPVYGTRKVSKHMLQSASHLDMTKVSAGQFAAKQAWQPAKPLMGGLMAFYFGRETYRGLNQGSEHFKPSTVEKAGALGLAAVQTAWMLLTPFWVDMLVTAPVLGAAYGQYRTGKRDMQMYNNRNWYKPNLAPLYSENALSGRRQGLGAIVDSTSFLGNEARSMAARGY
jgi:hypothetical protein